MKNLYSHTQRASVWVDVRLHNERTKTGRKVEHPSLRHVSVVQELDVWGRGGYIKKVVNRVAALRVNRV